MCDPSIMAIASMASGLADMAGQQSAQAQQKKSYDEWFAQQEKNRIEQSKKQEDARQLAEQARQQTVEDVSGTNVAKAQSDTAARLASEWSQGTPLTADAAHGGVDPGTTTSIADKYLLSGQPRSTSTDPNDQVFTSDLAAKLNAASKDAKQRIANLANVSSYNDATGGVNSLFRNMFQRSAGMIDKENEFRRGNLAVYGIQQAVQPVQWSYTPGLRIG